MTVHEAVHIALVAHVVPRSRVELETAKRVLEDLQGYIEKTLANAPSELVQETND